MSDGIDREITEISFNDPATINEWPSSQLCMDCKHGSFVMGEDIPASSYMCKAGVMLGPCASLCATFEDQDKDPVQDNRFIANDPIEW